MQPTLNLMEEVLDMGHSPAAQNDTLHFRYDDTRFVLEKGDEPRSSLPSTSCIRVSVNCKDACCSLPICHQW